MANIIVSLSEYSRQYRGLMHEQIKNKTTPRFPLLHQIVHGPIPKSLHLEKGIWMSREGEIVVKVLQKTCTWCVAIFIENTRKLIKADCNDIKNCNSKICSSKGNYGPTMSWP